MVEPPWADEKRTHLTMRTWVVEMSALEESRKERRELGLLSRLSTPMEPSRMWGGPACTVLALQTSARVPAD